MRNKYKGQDVKNRLTNTIIRWKNSPVICKTTDDGTVLNLYSLKNRSALLASVDPDDPDIDISSITLGYVQFGGEYNCAVYIRRLPRRIYKQGIDVNYLEYIPLSQRFTKNNVDVGQMFTNSVYDSLCDVFPSFNRALLSITKSGFESVALSKDVAIIRDKGTLKFHLKGSEIGFSNMSEPKDIVIAKNEASWVYKSILSNIDNNFNIREGL